MKIDVVIVTYNRLEKLKKAIESFELQTELPNSILIVNNNSNDGTKEYLEDWKKIEKGIKKEVINLSENIGGAGGFGTGIEYMMEKNSDWIWVSDDDAYPDKNAIKYACEYLENNKNRIDDISAICGAVQLKSGIDLNHRRTIKKGAICLKEVPSREEDYNKEEFEIDLFTYVAAIMNVSKLKKVGSTNKEYFIYYDDSDHSARLRKKGKIICVPKIRILHDVQEKNDSSKYDWKTYYKFRNKLFFYKSNFASKYYKIEKMLILIRILKKHNKSCTKLIKSAIKDFESNKMGKNDIYKPGVDIYKI